jgi:hypothetical protein
MFKIINFLDNDAQLHHKREEFRKKLRVFKEASEIKSQVANFSRTYQVGEYDSEELLSKYKPLKIIGQGSYALVS